MLIPLIPTFRLRQKMIIKKLQENGAISEATAKTLKEVGVFNPNAFPKLTEMLVQNKVLVMTKENKYYLNK